MAQEFTLPAVSEGVDSVDVAEVLVSEGDVIEAGQNVIEIETDKAAMEVPCPFGGKVVKIHVSPGDTVKVGGTVLTVETSEASSEGKSESSPSGSTTKQESAKEESAEQESAPVEASSSSEPADSDAVELVVIGGGPGGYPAAFEAADHGMQVVMIDEDIKPGGVCLHRGCIPSKALLHVAKLIQEARDASEHGVTFADPKIDLDKLRGFKESVVGQLTGGVQQLANARNVKSIRGRATLLSSNSLEVEKEDGSRETMSFRKAIVATGSKPAMPPIFDIGDDRVMDSSGALNLPDIPKRLLVVGGGYIGLEMGSVYAALGSEVTVVEMLSGLLPGADRDLVRPLQKRLEKQFHAIHLNTKVAKLSASDEGIVAELEGDGVESPQTFDRVLISIGRRPNSRGVGLENTRVELDDKGFVKVDSRQQTTDPNILAIGDVAGEPMLAHKATREAKVAVETLHGKPAEFDNIAIPAVVFTDPELAWCGLTETEAKDRGIEVNVVRFPWAASGRAQAIARTDGLTKLLIEPSTERILGVGIVGAGAGEMIAEGVLAVETAAVARDLAESIHAHPTLSETLMESAESAFGQATHMVRTRKK
ncbi:dihydrolipoyl dehydrogenase [Thalassoroseus pseudoceratinae]|uniref:dihydrolipoyl dehydrogenase n=1 Tax=Thalassoroseus pseudoceratinae TaxID=2713176 RepID=UPI00141FF980|nr:dihydrolipoyl dehydrogenase [Thalassoroseus pseudoceratinae]